MSLRKDQSSEAVARPSGPHTETRHSPAALLTTSRTGGAERPAAVARQPFAVSRPRRHHLVAARAGLRDHQPIIHRQRSLEISAA